MSAETGAHQVKVQPTFRSRSFHSRAGTKPGQHQRTPENLQHSLAFGGEHPISKHLRIPPRTSIPWQLKDKRHDRPGTMPMPMPTHGCSRRTAPPLALQLHMEPPGRGGAARNTDTPVRLPAPQCSLRVTGPSLPSQIPGQASSTMRLKSWILLTAPPAMRYTAR